MADTVAVKVTGEDEGVSTLLRTLSKQLGEVQKSQKAANAEAAAGAKAQTSLAKSVTGTIANLKKLATAYAVIRTLNFVKDQIDAADALSKLAEKSGITTETLSALAFAGETADVSIDQLGTSAKLFAKSTADLARGSGDAADAFHSLGISAKDLKDLSPDEQFLKTLKTLGSYEDGLAKAEVAQKIFGKSGAELIPLANQVAEEGFGSISAAALKAGKLISGEAGKAAEAFNDQLSTMKAQAEGAALAFGQEVVPAISDVLTALSTLKGEGDETFVQSLGSGAAKAIRFTAVIAITAFKTIGEGLGLLARTGVETFQAIKSAASFDFDGFNAHAEAARESVKDLKHVVVSTFGETQDALDKAEKERAAKTTADRKKREDTEKKRLVLANQKEVEEIAKARAEAEEHAREGEGKILAANLALKDQEVQHAFDHGLTSLAAYFAARRQTIVEAGQQEIAALKASRDAIAKQPVATPVQRIQRDDQVAQKTVDIKVAEAKITQQLNDLDEQRGTLAVSLAQTIGDAEAKIRQARGDSSAQAKQSLDHDVEEYRKALAQLGTLTDGEQKALVNKFRVTLTLDIDAQENQRQVDALFGDIDRKRQELDQRVSLGLQSQASAQQELAQFEAGRLPTLTQLADQMERFGLALDNPQLQAAAAELKIKLEGLGKAASEAARLTAELGSDIKDSLEGDLSNFLGTTITQVGSLGEAFKSLAISVVASIQQIIAKLLAAKAVEGIARLLSGFSGGPSLPSIASGSAIDAGIASAVSKVFGFAEGGYTGPGGKYQPAGIVHRGEYVIPARAVKRIGLSRLDALAGLRTHAVVRPRRGYAEGGLVGGLSAVTLGGSIALDVSHEGTKVQSADVFLTTPQGEKAVLKVIARHGGKLGLRP